jgi:hypothetical protein
MFGEVTPEDAHSPTDNALLPQNSTKSIAWWRRVQRADSFIAKVSDKEREFEIETIRGKWGRIYSPETLRPQGKGAEPDCRHCRSLTACQKG